MTIRRMAQHPLTEARRTRPDAMLWANMAVRPGFSWPNVQVEIPFEGRTMVLQPGTEQHSRAVSVYDESGTNIEEGGSRVSRFLSYLAWSQDAALVDLFLTGTNNPAHPGYCGASGQAPALWAAVDPWHTLYVPVSVGPRGDLALALFREGMGLEIDLSPFALLSFAKVLNISLAQGKDQISWINGNVNVNVIPSWSRGNARLEKLLASGVQDIGEYLYGQGRCAVAHANSMTVNPDDYASRSRIRSDIPLMRDVAALFIEREFGIEREHTFSARVRDQWPPPSNVLMPRKQPSGAVRYVPAEEAMSMI